MSIERVTESKMLLLDAGSGDMLEIDWRMLGGKSSHVLVAFVADPRVGPPSDRIGIVALIGFLAFCVGSCMLLAWTALGRGVRIAIACVLVVTFVPGCDEHGQVTGLHFDPPELKLGPMKQHEELQFVATLRNEGPASVELTKVETTCGCFAVNFEPMTISPHSDAVITARLRAAVPGTREQSVMAHGISQGIPVRCILPVKFQVERSASLSPPAFPLGTIEPGDPISDVLSVRIDDPSGELRGRTASELKPVGKWALSYQLAVAKKKLEDGEAVEIQYRVPPETGGHFVDRVNLIADGGVNPMVFTVVVSGCVFRDR